MILPTWWVVCLAFVSAQTRVDVASSVQSESSVSNSLVEDSDCVPDDEGKDPNLCGHARRSWGSTGYEVDNGDPRGGVPREAEDATDVLHYFLDIELIPEYSGPTPTAVSRATA